MNTLENLQYNRRAFLEKIVKEQEVTITTPHGTALTLRSDVFVPHPDTYQLIDLAHDIVIKHLQIQTVADLGTGSGIIAVTLASFFKDKTFVATDISQKAIKLAKHNASLNNASNINFVLTGKDEWINEALLQSVDFIVSNPPYIGDKEFNSEDFYNKYPETKYEPLNAIRTFDTLGLSPYVKILDQSRKLHTPFYLFQCNARYIGDLIRSINPQEFNIEIKKDTNNNDRFIFLKRKE